MNYNNIKIFKNEKVAHELAHYNLDYQAGKLTDRDLIIARFSEFLSKKNVFIFTDSNVITIKLPDIIVGYRDGNTIKTESLIERWVDPNFNIMDLYNKDDDTKTKSVALSILISYYLAISNYKKVLEIFKLISKEADSIKFIKYNYRDAFSNEDEKGNLFVDAKKILALLYSGSKSGNFSLVEEGKYYIGLLSEIATLGVVDEYLQDNTIKFMHQRVMHDYFELNKGKVKKMFRSVNRAGISFLDSLETDSAALNSFLSMFPTGNDDSYFWGKIRRRDDWRLQSFLPHLDNEKERLIEVFNSYLYSQYAIGQTTKGLEDTILRMISAIEILKYDEFNIMDIVKDLPEKIQRFALKSMLGD